MPLEFGEAPFSTGYFFCSMAVTLVKFYCGDRREKLRSVSRGTPRQ
jgi:hypothetical protein